MITLDQADAVLKGSRAKAGELGVVVTVAVMDAGANLKALSRMDGSWLGAMDIAIRKARTAVLF